EFTSSAKLVFCRLPRPSTMRPRSWDPTARSGICSLTRSRWFRPPGCFSPGGNAVNSRTSPPSLATRRKELEYPFAKEEAMRRIVVFLAALLVTTVAWAVDSTSYSLDVDVSPTHQPSNYLCKAIITDLSNGTVIFAPSIQLRAGAPANASIVEC